MPEAGSLLVGWSTFFVAMCTSAAALIGLMFVVITLVSGAMRVTHSTEGLATFSTPTVVHFSAALFVSAVLTAPWHSLVGADLTIGLAALIGLGYALRILLRARHITRYVPDFEDWAWHLIMPFFAYGAIVGGAVALNEFAQPALFVVAGGVLLLLFIGIHNAWDVVTYLAMEEASTDEPPA
jgi:hypothetical protein